MKVHMIGGPYDGEVFPYVRHGNEELRYRGFMIPIYYVPEYQKWVAHWCERKERRP